MEIKDFDKKYYSEFVEMVGLFQAVMTELDPISNIPFKSDEDCRKYADQLIEDYRTMNGKLLIAIDEDGDITGFIQGIIDEHKGDVLHHLAHKPQPNGAIGVLYVKEKYRSRGIGRLLMETISDYFIKSGCPCIHFKVLANNENAIGLYEKLGFSPRSMIMQKIL